jgi:prepilin-type N-terminal cleavage/methylation domain-containing protein
MKRPLSHTGGFTLVELIIAMAVGMIVLFAIYAASELGQKSSVAVERKVLAQQEARAALDIMAMEIRMASFNPNRATGLWANGPATTATQAYRGIQEATADSITIEMDISGDSSIGAANEIIRYHYDTANMAISRDTGGGGQRFLGAPTGDVRDVRVVNNSANVPVFRYFDRTGAELVPGTDLPAGIPDISRIEITLVVDTEDVDPNLKQRRRTIYGTTVIPRNHAINF